MISDIALSDLLRQGESDRVEFKQAPTDKDRICEAVCAFANDLPDHRESGVMVIGIDDQGGCANLAITEELVNDISDLRTNGNIHPFPSMTVQRRSVDGCNVIVVEVQPSDLPPVRYKGRTYIRVGARRSIATADEERRLAEKRRFHVQPFDVRPIPEASIDDLDLNLFERTYLPAAFPADLLAQNSRSGVEKLKTLRFLSPDSAPTVLGVLTLGIDPTRYLPGAYVQFVRFAGAALSDDIKAQREVSGPLPDMLRRLDELLETNISIAIEIRTATTEFRYPDYPIVALRQLAWNSILHRTYEGTNAPVRINWFDDRVEIQNPGGPFGQVTRENFGRRGVADYRNPNLAEAMKVLGYVQKFGLGIELARQELGKNENPDLQFTVEDTYVLATVRR